MIGATPAIARASSAIRRSVIDTPTQRAAPIMARAALAAALDVEEMARAMYAANPLIVGEHGEEVPWEAIVSDPDRVHIAVEHRRDAQAARTSVLGPDAASQGAAGGRVEVWELDVEDDDDY